MNESLYCNVCLFDADAANSWLVRTNIKLQQRGANINKEELERVDAGSDETIRMEERNALTGGEKRRRKRGDER